MANYPISDTKIIGSFAPREHDSSCSLCGELHGTIAPIHRIAVPMSPQSRILRTKNNWMAVPSIGPLAPGHLMMVCKQHFPSVLNCSDANDCFLLAQECATILESLYGSPIIAFEHGCRSGGLNLSGACVQHAHLHLVPAPMQFLRNVLADFDGWQRSINLNYPLEAFADVEYLLIGNVLPDLSLWLHKCHEPSPSQALRRALANSLGISEAWDWKKSARGEVFLQTIKD